MKYVKIFSSYEDLVLELVSNKYIGLILKVGTDRCPPCLALDKGPLENVANTINKKLDSKEILVVNVNLSKNEAFAEELFEKLQINMPRSVPTFYIFSYKDNQLSLCETTAGFDMSNPEYWEKNFTDMIIKKIIG